VYDSFTGNVERFVKKLNVKAIKVTSNLTLSRPSILITYTTGFGEVPKSTIVFLDKNKNYIIGIAVSGNRNWGNNFARAADIISEKYNIPIIHKFELSGTPEDVQTFLQEAQRIVTSTEMDRTQQ
jgi:ribonucleoside-diphosphate reductase 2, operon protein nrdI